jgi:hypothetical protein
MLGQKKCPFCATGTGVPCGHLALAVEARQFISRCIESSQAHAQWREFCDQRRGQRHSKDGWCPEQEDFTWLETAFCNEFLKSLRWFGALDYEWRTGPKDGQGGFWVLLWSKSPQRLWWELRDAFEERLGRL